MSNELAILDENRNDIVTPKRRSILTVSTEQLSRLKTLASMMHGSQLSYAKNGSSKMSEGDIFIKMLKGVEVGLEPIASMDLIHIIQGKPTLSPQGMLALIWGSGLMESLNIVDDGKACKVTMKRTGVPAHTEIFSVNDADKMGLSGRDGWQKQGAVMRKWRAVSACARIVFPDIIQGMYIPEEIAPELPFDTDGEIVETEIEAPPPAPQETITPSPVSKSEPNSNGSNNIWTPDNIATFIDKFAERFPTPHTHYLPILGKLNVGALSDLGTFEQAREKLFEKCYEGCAPVKVEAVRYVINGKSKHLEFVANPDPKLRHGLIRAYGRSDKFRTMLEGALAGLYDKLELDDYSVVTQTTEWQWLSVPLLLHYSSGGTDEYPYYKVDEVEVPDEYLEF